MKSKLFLLGTMIFLMHSALSAEDLSAPVNSADTIRMDFESIPDFSLNLSPWISADLDHHSTYGIQNHTYPNDTVSKAFICFNPSAVTPPMADSAIKAHSGKKYAACFSAIPAPNNDWLISPKVHMVKNGSFSLWVKSYTDAYGGLEEYKILVSVTDSSPASFTAISGTQALLAPVSWTKKTFNLSGYTNQDVYIAIQCVSSDHFIFMVDDIEIITNSSGVLKADFKADRTQIGAGEKVNFLDLSTGFPSSWQWTFTGGSPSSSTIQNPTGITYSNPGNYDVKLIAGNTNSTDTAIFTGYIHVGGFPSSASLDFEQFSDFTLDLSPWTTIDVNGGETYTMMSGNTQIVFPHSGQPMSFICFNPSATVPVEQFMKPHTGRKLGCCFSSFPPRNPNNKWLISPRLTLGTSSMLDLWVMTYDPKYMECYNVAVSTTDTDPTSFINLKSAPDTAPTEWTHRYYDLRNYNNKTVYVAIQCVSDDKFIFMVDDININSVAGITNDQESFRLSVYPNPARGFIYFSSALPAGTPVTIRLINMTGAEKRKQDSDSRGSGVIDVHDLSPGLYTLVAEAGDRISVQKIIIQ